MYIYINNKCFFIFFFIVKRYELSIKLISFPDSGGYEGWRQVELLNRNFINRDSIFSLFHPQIIITHPDKSILSSMVQYEYNFRHVIFKHVVYF